MAMPPLKGGPAEPSADKPDQYGAEDDNGEGHAEEEDAEEGRAGEGDHDVVLQCALSHAHHGLNDNGEDGGLQPEEQRGDNADLAIGGIDVAERHDGDDARQD